MRLVAGRVVVLHVFPRLARAVGSLKRLGRAVLWLLVLVLLLRGLASVMEPRRPATAASSPEAGGGDVAG